MSNFSHAQKIVKPATVSRGGIVASQHRVAAEVGAEVLANGGNAIDAAVAVSFAVGVVEPWMSGPAGGGVMMIWDGKASRAHALSYGMRAPSGLDPRDYPLSGKETADDLFPWKGVVDDRNVMGATAVAVPGVVDGIGKAHERFGTMPWRDLLQPAVRLAKEGLLVDWYAALMIASATRSLAADPDAAAVFLEDGQWPTIAGWTALAEKRIVTPGLADTLETIAAEGARAFYDGDVGAALARDVADKGGSLSAADLKAYQAEWQEPLSFAYRDARFHVTPRLTAGPTIANVFRRLEEGLSPSSRPDASAYAAYTRALAGAYEDRLSKMGDNESPAAPASTTHFSIVDQEGTMVAMTQTLLSAFGSRVVSPSTGLLLNNGIMWFDPEPGHANSLEAGKRCLMNVCPVLGESGGTRFALGASGGRKIVGAVAQLASFLADFGMSLDEAFHTPRIDVSGGKVTIADEALPADVLEAIGEESQVMTAKRTVFPYAFACPAGVARDAEGRNFGATEIMSPWGDAVAE